MPTPTPSPFEVETVSEDDEEDEFGNSPQMTAPSGEPLKSGSPQKTLDRDAENHERIEMLISHDNDRVEELIAHNKSCNLVAKQHDKEASGEDTIFTFHCVI